MRSIVSLIVLGGFFLHIGCQANLDTVEAPQIPPSPVTEPVAPPQGDPQMTPSPSAPVGANLQNLIDKATADLAQRLSIPATQIQLVEATPVVWPDSSLGCPQPGMAYKQIPYDGALIILQAQGTPYEYHNGGSRGLFLCEKIYKDPYTPPKLDINNLTRPLLDKNTPPASTPENDIPSGEDQ